MYNATPLMTIVCLSWSVSYAKEVAGPLAMRFEDEPAVIRKDLLLRVVDHYPAKHVQAAVLRDANEMLEIGFRTEQMVIVQEQKVIRPYLVEQEVSAR